MEEINGLGKSHSQQSIGQLVKIRMGVKRSALIYMLLMAAAAMPLQQSTPAAGAAAMT